VGQVRNAVLPTPVAAPSRSIIARSWTVVIGIGSVVIARWVIRTVKVGVPRWSAVAGTAVSLTIIDARCAVIRLTVIGPLAVVRLLVEVVKQKWERERDAPADLSLSWALGGKKQTACYEQNNEGFHKPEHNPSERTALEQSVDSPPFILLEEMVEKKAESRRVYVGPRRNSIPLNCLSLYRKMRMARAPSFFVGVQSLLKSRPPQNIQLRSPLQSEWLNFLSAN
jgi:hypothetical protein